MKKAELKKQKELLGFIAEIRDKVLDKDNSEYPTMDQMPRMDEAISFHNESDDAPVFLSFSN